MICLDVILSASYFSNYLSSTNKSATRDWSPSFNIAVTVGTKQRLDAKLRSVNLWYIMSNIRPAFIVSLLDQTSSQIQRV